MSVATSNKVWSDSSAGSSKSISPFMSFISSSRSVKRGSSSCAVMILACGCWSGLALSIFFIISVICLFIFKPLLAFR